MFTTLKYRRHIAVLATLAMVASVMVAAPVVAADDPIADYTADFNACIGDAADSAGFEDVGSITSAGSIDCIAYYGITQGTSATTYSPSMLVTREHMALFLTRLAGLVKVPLASDPADAGFTDIGELTAESQTAINQLADLGITKGTSETTYSPADAVTRGHMALFIARLMDNMKPIGGDKSAWGHTPSDVVVNEAKDIAVGSPFTDLGSVTKSTYDAITALWELGVASGYNATSYAPQASITRAHMADFMAGVLNHSNARPAGLSIQVSRDGSGYVASGSSAMGTYIVSVRDDSFAPVADQSVDVFDDPDALQEDGTCVATVATGGDCTWLENDSSVTGADGNIIEDAGADYGMTNVYYAWIGDESGNTFDSDDVDYVTASITAMKAESSMEAETSISDRAQPGLVDLDRVSSVTITAQLIDASGDDVMRAGVDVQVGINLGEGAVVNNSVATLTTDDNGQVSYTTDAPEDDDDTDDIQTNDTTLENRVDVITFTYKGKETVDTSSNSAQNVDGNDQAISVTINWSEADSITANSSSSAPLYVMPDKEHDVTIVASATLYDQYGSPFRQGTDNGPQQVTITIGSGVASSSDDPAEGNANVNRNGVGSRGRTMEFTSGTSRVGSQIEVTFDTNPGTLTFHTALPADSTLTKNVQVVRSAEASDTGLKTVWITAGDDNKFLVDGDNTDQASIAYSYDSGDVFINAKGEVVSIEDFEKAIGAGLSREDLGVTGSADATVNVVSYDTDGSSIFKVMVNARSGAAS